MGLKNDIKLIDIGPKLKDLNLKLLCKEQFNIKIMGKLNLHSKVIIFFHFYLWYIYYSRRSY